MIRIERNLIGAKQTGKLMHRMINLYYRDMAPWASLSYPEFFEVMKNIPFKEDPPNIELIKRPFYTMKRIGPGGDCDDKTIAVCSWAKLSQIPYKIVGVGNRKPGQSKKSRILLSHVYPELYIGGKWIPFDATYGFNILGKTLPKYDKHVLL